MREKMYSDMRSSEQQAERFPRLETAASAIKRYHNIKDYGKLIPGHGGILDRFDSVIFTAPIIYYLALFL